MGKNKNIKTFLFSIIGVWLLLAPMLFELYHVVSDFHVNDKVCTELTTHIHQKPVDCSLCDFHATFYTFTIHEIEFGFTTIFYPTIFPLTNSLKELKPSAHYRLRAPPYFV